MRDAEGATEGSSAKHRNEVESKAARPKLRESVRKGTRPKIKNAQLKVEHCEFMFRFLIKRFQECK